MKTKTELNRIIYENLKNNKDMQYLKTIGLHNQKTQFKTNTLYKNLKTNEYYIIYEIWKYKRIYNDLKEITIKRITINEYLKLNKYKELNIHNLIHYSDKEKYGYIKKP